jgi:membrane protease YdiL (CAAX protease family)
MSSITKKIASFYPSLGWSWVLVAVLFSSMCMVAFPVAMMNLLTGRSLMDSSWVSLSAYVAPFVLTAGFIWLLQRTNPAEKPAAVKKNLSPVVFLCCLVFTPLLAFLIEPLTAWLPMPDFIKDLFAQLSKTDFPSFLMVAVVAPFCEEWLCRGVIAKGLLRHSTPAKAILWSAFIFAVIHLNPWQAVPAFIIGLLLGYVYWKTRSLWPCIFIHFINNGGSFLVIYLFPQATANASSQELLGSWYLPAYAAAALAAVGMGAVLWRMLHSQWKIENENT